MNKLFSVLSAVAVVGAMASAPASAFWGGGGPWGNSGSGGGPWNAMTDAFGGGDINFNAKSYGHGSGSACQGFVVPVHGFRLTVNS